MKYTRSSFFRSDFTESDTEKFKIQKKLRQKVVKYYESRNWPANMSGRSARWSFVNQSVILKISYDRPRRSYITELVTVDPIYNWRNRCKISLHLILRLLFLISCRPPFIFIAYRIQFDDSRNDIFYTVQTHIFEYLYIWRNFVFIKIRKGPDVWTGLKKKKMERENLKKKWITDRCKDRRKLFIIVIICNNIKDKTNNMILSVTFVKNNSVFNKDK